MFISKLGYKSCESVRGSKYTNGISKLLDAFSTRSRKKLHGTKKSITNDNTLLTASTISSEYSITSKVRKHLSTKLNLCDDKSQMKKERKMNEPSAAASKQAVQGYVGK